ncbi:hypothetical protein [Rathayibacter tritici]|nr:hypothetical protein [Rathayibacter tritici]
MQSATSEERRAVIDAVRRREAAEEHVVSSDASWPTLPVSR